MNIDEYRESLSVAEVIGVLDTMSNRPTLPIKECVNLHLTKITLERVTEAMFYQALTEGRVNEGSLSF